MKKLAFILVLICVAVSVHAQDKQKITPGNVQEVFPKFPGGNEALVSYLSENLTYPKEAARKGIQGRVYISFIVNKEGKVTEATILKGIGYGCDEEALRVVNEMPDWMPATVNGEPVPVKYNLPVAFMLKKAKKKKKK